MRGLRGRQRSLGADQGDKRKGRGIGQLPRGSLMGQETERHAGKPRGREGDGPKGHGAGQEAQRKAEGQAKGQG